MSNIVGQTRYVSKIAPFFWQAKTEGKEEDFLTALYGHWFDRWPVKAENYDDLDLMKHAVEFQKRVCFTLLRAPTASRLIAW